LRYHKPVRLRILDRYVLKEMLGPFFVGLVVYSFLFLINLLFQLATMIIQQGLSATVTGVIFLLSLPNLLSYTLPVATLVGTIIGYSRLSADSEIIALRAAGIPGRWFVVPPLLFGAAVTAVLLVFNLWLIPACRYSADRLQSEAAQAVNVVRLLKPGVFFDKIPGVLLYAERADAETARYEKVLIVQHPAPSQDSLTLAEWGKVVRSPDGGFLQFLLGDGETLQFDRKAPGRVLSSTFKEQAFTIEKPAGFAGSSGKSLSEYGTLELYGKLDLPPVAKDPALQRKERYGWIYELHRRLATAVAALFFAVVGVPLGMVNVRGGKGAGFSLSIIVLLGYWILLSALGDLSLAGRLRPEVAAWFPDLALAAVGLLLMARKNRAAEPFWFKPFLLLFPSRQEAPEAARGRALRPVGITRGIPILDRYLFRRMLVFLLLIAASILLLDWIIEVRGLSEYINNAEQARRLFKYLINQSPSVVVMLTPLTVLLTALVTFGILERNNEVLAMKASGISLYRLCLPALALGLAACGFLWAMGEAVVPGTSQKAQTTRDRIKNIAARNMARTIDVWLFAPGRQTLYHYNHWNAEEERFQGFSVYRFAQERFRLQERFFAKRVAFTGEEEVAYARGWEWKRGRPEPLKLLPKGDLHIGMPLDYFVVPPFLEGQYFSSRELKKLIGELQDRGYPSYQQRVDYYHKFSGALAPLVLLVVGLPFAFSTGRRGSLYGIALALVLSVTYYTLQAVFTSIGAMQWLDPALAAWTPAVLLWCVGSYLLLNLRT
jgi:LPS export ABC transporter permease LptF/LPS export ABC transporter permease LptG